MKPPSAIAKASFMLFASVLLLPFGSLPMPQAVAQNDNRKLVQKRSETVTALPGQAKRWALVIGVDQYRDSQISSLKGAANDARTLKEALIKYAGFPSDQVILLASDQPEERQPTRINILRRLSNLASVVPSDGLLLVSFAGHGMERQGRAFLIPSDAQLSDDIDFVEETAISVARMKDRIKATGVQQIVVLLDACRNDPAGRADAPNPLTEAYVKGFDFDVRNREVTAFATIYATAVGYRAYESGEKRQGYFTLTVVEALSGAAANDKSEVTLAALLNYVQEQVPKRVGVDLGKGKQQRPFAVIDGYKANELVMAIAPIGGRKEELAKVDPAALELSFWDSIKNSNDPADFEVYLEKWPNGTFVVIARSRIKALALPTVKAKSDPPSTVNSPTNEQRNVFANVSCFNPGPPSDGVLQVLPGRIDFDGSKQKHSILCNEIIQVEREGSGTALSTARILVTLRDKKKYLFVIGLRGKLTKEAKQLEQEQIYEAIKLCVGK